MSQPIHSSNQTSRRERLLIGGLIAIGLVLVLLFGFRAVRSYIRIQQTGLEPGVTDVEAIRGWMTVPYIAQAYGLPQDYIFEQLGIPAAGNQKKGLGQLNREYAPGERGAMIETVKAAIRQYQAKHLPTPGKRP